MKCRKALTVLDFTAENMPALQKYVETNDPPACVVLRRTISSVWGGKGDNRQQEIQAHIVLYNSEKLPY